MVRADFQCPPEMSNRVVALAPQGQREAQVVVRVIIVRREVYGFLKVANCGGDLAA